MNLKFTKTTVVHPILFAIFPILLIITSNLNEIILIDALVSFLLVMTVMLSSWFILNLFSKNKLKSGLFVSFGLVVFFSYGHFVSIISELGINISTLPFSYHTIAIPIYFLILILGFVAIIKTKKLLHHVTIFTNILAIVIIAMLLPNVVSYSFENFNITSVDNPLDYKILHESELNNMPNIYFILLDEYTDNEILKKIYSFDNQNFLSKLEQRGFFIPSKIHSNYSTSPLALSAILNMNYVNDKISNPTLDDKNELFNNNQIMRILKSLDYTIVTMSFFHGYPDIADYHLCPPPLFVTQFHTSLLETSLWHPFSKLFITAGQPQRDIINCQFSELSDLHKSFDSPFFVYAHLLSPHPPYLFGPNGESATPEFLSIGAASWDDKPGYVNQVQYINKKVIETIDKILLENDSPPVIIIQGDHGTPTQLGGGGLRWNNINDDSISERMSIFNAYYFPDIDSKVIYDGITPVNSFRLVLNNYLNGDYELLEDRIYFSTYQNMLNFTDVTSIISNP